MKEPLIKIKELVKKYPIAPEPDWDAEDVCNMDDAAFEYYQQCRDDYNKHYHSQYDKIAIDLLIYLTDDRNVGVAVDTDYESSIQYDNKTCITEANMHISDGCFIAPFWMMIRDRRGLIYKIVEWANGDDDIWPLWSVHLSHQHLTTKMFRKEREELTLAQIKDQDQWCNKNCVHGWKSSTSAIYHFEDKDDAFRFLMTFAK